MCKGYLREDRSQRVHAEQSRSEKFHCACSQGRDLGFVTPKRGALVATEVLVLS